MFTRILVAFGLIAAFLPTAKAQDAKQILDASGIRGGLVVVIGSTEIALADNLLTVVGRSPETTMQQRLNDALKKGDPALPLILSAAGPPPIRSEVSAASWGTAFRRRCR